MFLSITLLQYAEGPRPLKPKEIDGPSGKHVREIYTPLYPTFI